MTQLLDLFEAAPLLRDIKLVHLLPDSSNASAERTVTLPHLRSLAIYAQPAHSILLNRLRIPTGAMVSLEFDPLRRSPPMLDYPPKSLGNLSNTSHITSISLDFSGLGITMQLKGPSGGLLMSSAWAFQSLTSPEFDHLALQALEGLPISPTERLAIHRCYFLALPETEETTAYQTLFPMNNLRTLTVAGCTNLPLLVALNPTRNTSNTVVCPYLKELILYAQTREEELYTESLLEMAKGRASIGAGLSTIAIASRWEVISEDELSDLRGCVQHVEYRECDKVGPATPDEVGHNNGRSVRDWNLIV